MAAAWNKGKKLSDETRARMSQAQKGRTHPWNKGVEAWNRNKEWPIEVRENISRGMIAYWIQRKEIRLGEFFPE